MPVLSLDALAERIKQLKPAAGATAVVAIDGPAGSGKTTLARRLSERLDAPMVHMDDLYPGWDGLAEAAVGIAQQVLVPLADQQPARYRRYDWDRAEYAEWVDVPPTPILLVEGCGSGSTPGAACLSMLIWVEAPHHLRMARGVERDGEGFRPHWERWARQEAALFAAESTRERADVLLDSGSAVPHDPEREVVADGPDDAQVVRR